MARRPWMPLYIADYLADTAHLNAAQSGAYLHLIMHYWQMDGLPTNDDALARIARMTPTEWKKNRTVIAAFFDDDWKHGRIESELATAEDKSEKAATSAKRRWGKRNANALEPHMQSMVNIGCETDAVTITTRKEDDDEARARASKHLERMCEVHRIKLQADPQRFTWESQLRALIDDGFTDPQIAQGIEISRQKGVCRMEYVTACVRNPPKPAATASPSKWQDGRSEEDQRKAILS